MTPKLTRATQSGHAKLSFSKLGEDAVLLWIFAEKRSGFYVDIGCHHPYRYSNTAILYCEYDWHGVNIDVEPRAIEVFRAERPGDVNICSAVGDRTESVEAFFFDDGALTTLNPTAARNPYFANVPRTSQAVQVRRLGDILDEVLSPDCRVDLLNIDVEGLDLEVLASNDWQAFRPLVVSVEAHGLDLNDPTHNPTWRFLRDRGYDLVSHVGVTSIFKSSQAV